MATNNFDERARALRWMTDSEFAAAGHSPHGPEIDYGMRWGHNNEVRVSFAPTSDNGTGYLYAYDKLRKRCALLCESTTFAEVEAAWRALIDEPVKGNDFLLIADAVDAASRIEEAQTVWLHCVEQELAARHDYRAPAGDAEDRFEAGRQIVIAECARAASESVLIEALSSPGQPFGPPAVVRYQVLEQDNWTGRVAGADLAAAVEAAMQVQKLAECYDFTFQATSMRHGNTVLAAARVPELRELAGIGMEQDSHRLAM
jgi:hypothetical protein